MAPSFEALAREYTAPLGRFLRRQIGDAVLAEDLLQETLLRISRGLAGFEGRASPRTWLFRIATHVVADHLRQRLGRDHRIVPLDEADALPAAAPEPETRIIIDEMNQCVREVIDSLPLDYRTALVLCDLEGMSNAEMAEVLGLSLGTAKVRLHRARARLRTALGAQCGLYRDSENVLRCVRREPEVPACFSPE